MLQATEQQLQLVTRKVQRLEQSVHQEMEHLRHIRVQRNEAISHLQQLREQLAVAEERAEVLTRDHEEAQAHLRQSAEEYAAAQLLQKKYLNTVSSLQGNCRAVVRLQGTRHLASALGSAAAAQPSSLHPQDALTIADDCTVNAIDRKKSFVLDAVFDENAMLVDEEGFLAMLKVPESLAELLSGTNQSFFTFGPRQSGKTTFLFGSAAAAAATLPSGLANNNKSRSVSSTNGAAHQNNVPAASHEAGFLARYVKHLFASLEAHDVTHFNIRCSFGEWNPQDPSMQVVDLLSDYGPAMGMGGGSRGGLASSSGTSAAAAAHPANDLSSVQVQSPAEVYQLVALGMQRALHGKSRGGTASSSSVRYATHLVFYLHVENFNTRGHFRRSTATFVDLCGSSTTPTEHQPQGTVVLSSEQSAVNRSLAALCDVISMTSAASQQHLQNTGQPLLAPIQDIPHRGNRLVQIMRDAVGGNSVATMLCCINAMAGVTKATVDEMLSALTYAFYYKAVKNFAVPYDIPPELQRLNLQMNRLGADE